MYFMTTIMSINKFGYILLHVYMYECISLYTHKIVFLLSNGFLSVSTGRCLDVV